MKIDMRCRVCLDRVILGTIQYVPLIIYVIVLIVYIQIKVLLQLTKMID